MCTCEITHTCACSYIHLSFSLSLSLSPLGMSSPNLGSSFTFPPITPTALIAPINLPGKGGRGGERAREGEEGEKGQERGKRGRRGKRGGIKREINHQTLLFSIDLTAGGSSEVQDPLSVNSGVTSGSSTLHSSSLPHTPPPSSQSSSRKRRHNGSPATDL